MGVWLHHCILVAIYGNRQCILCQRSCLHLEILNFDCAADGCGLPPRVCVSLFTSSWNEGSLYHFIVHLLCNDAAMSNFLRLSYSFHPIYVVVFSYISSNSHILPPPPCMHALHQRSGMPMLGRDACTRQCS